MCHACHAGLVSPAPGGCPSGVGCAALGGIAALKQTMDDAGIDLIAEKIETEKMLVELLEHNIDFGQGYLFGEPRMSKDPPPAYVEDMPPSA